MIETHEQITKSITSNMSGNQTNFFTTGIKTVGQTPTNGGFGGHQIQTFGSFGNLNQSQSIGGLGTLSGFGNVGQTPTNGGFGSFNQTPTNGGFGSLNQTQATGNVGQTPTNGGFGSLNQTQATGNVGQTPTNGGFGSLNQTNQNHSNDKQQVLQCLLDSKNIQLAILNELKSINAGIGKTKTVHFGVFCNSCGKQNITGVRYKCLFCNDMDLCEECEANSSHDVTHNFIKIKDTKIFNDMIEKKTLLFNAQRTL